MNYLLVSPPKFHAKNNKNYRTVHETVNINIKNLNRIIIMFSGSWHKNKYHHHGVFLSVHKWLRMFANKIIISLMKFRIFRLWYKDGVIYRKKRTKTNWTDIQISNNLGLNGNSKFCILAVKDAKPLGWFIPQLNDGFVFQFV